MYPSLFIDNVVNNNFYELYKNILGMKKLYGFHYTNQLLSFIRRSIMSSNKISIFTRNNLRIIF